MKILRSLTNSFLCLFVFLAIGSVSFGAEPIAPERVLNDSRRPSLSDKKPSSLLVFNLYTSSATDPGKQDTSFSITNASNEQSAFVHLFLVSGNCSVADVYICLTKNQTASFLASEIDPGITGYGIAVATDNAGCPLSFNYLLGSEFVKLESGHAANLPTEGYAALFNGRLPGCSSTNASAILALDGVRYNAAARVLAVDKIFSLADGNQTLLIVNSLVGNLAIGMQPIRDIEGTLYDDAEVGITFKGTAACQLNSLLSNTFPRTTPRFETFIPEGRNGWMQLMAKEDKAISGAVINFNPEAATRVNRFNGGRNLPPLRFTNGELTIPVFAPIC